LLILSVRLFLWALLEIADFIFMPYFFYLRFNALTAQSLGETLLKKGYPLHELVRANPLPKTFGLPSLSAFFTVSEARKSHK
jgi:hypothetical protein